MGHDHGSLQRKIDALRRTRDELQVKVHLGRMDAQVLWEEIERRWKPLEANAKQLTRVSGDALERTRNAIRESIKELREGYDQLAAKLRETHPDSLWDQVRNTFDRLVEGGHRATERVVDSFGELGDAAKVRVEKARLERALIRKCAELGTQIYTLAKQPRLPDGKPPQILDDDKVKSLLQEVGSLDADLRKAAAECLEPDGAHT